ncbi:MAG: nitronate monooxygenase [Actinobacteria bacterium]|jgi:NAD(P)H-dependent flavin oxidoreductase YrpB (nitropropane dioxygenase family)|nr:nitronate monooxygenase [Actinomycetota bacterium]
MSEHLPVIIQGGMGIAVSNWELAKTVSLKGQLGVVSGTAIDNVMARRLQDGDKSGNTRRALAAFPNQEIVQKILAKYFVDGGKAPETPYIMVPKITLEQKRDAQEILIVANFVEVWLAKEGHDGLVGINFLHKIQMTTAASVLGAMLAGVDYIIMGAGIPRELPKLIRQISKLEVGSVPVDVIGGPAAQTTINPLDFVPSGTKIKKPKFLAIISVDVLGTYLARDEETRPDGFIIEHNSAGGHNAPPRGKWEFDANGEPIYGPKDIADIEKMKKLGLPFWLAGTYGSPERVKAALNQGAAGVQVGTLFAISNHSGFSGKTRKQLLDKLKSNSLEIKTDVKASPTSFPIKIAKLEGHTSTTEGFAARPKLCDLGYLREPAISETGRTIYRCPSEPDDQFIKKGGAVEDIDGRKCLCNGLMANIGLPQARKDGYVEAPIVTLGSDIEGAKVLLKSHPDGYGADEAVNWLLSLV